MKLSSLALLALAPLALARVGPGEFIIEGGMNFIGRVDPIIAPGRVGDHVHTVFGASNFREVLNTPAEQARGECTSATVSADMSHYWAPTVGQPPA